MAKQPDRDEEIQRRDKFANEPQPRRYEPDPDREVRRFYKSEPDRSEPRREPPEPRRTDGE